MRVGTSMRTQIAAVGMILLLSVAVIAARQNGNDLYQQGLARETAGDIKGAIQIFERIVGDSASNRTLTAKALVQLGRWSDLLGQDQARKYYERVLREYADQGESASEARNRLAALDSSRPAGTLTARRVDVPLDRTSSLTPDGRFAAITDWTTGDLAVYDMSSGQTRRLMASPGWSPTGSWVEGGALSPDLKQVAYTYATHPGLDQRYQLRIMANQPHAPS